MSEKTKLIGKNGCKKMKLTVTRKITASIHQLHTPYKIDLSLLKMEQWRA